MEPLEQYVSLGIALKTLWNAFVSHGQKAVAEADVCRVQSQIDNLLRSVVVVDPSSQQSLLPHQNNCRSGVTVGATTSTSAIAARGASGGGKGCPPLPSIEQLVLSPQGAEVFPLIAAMAISPIPSPTAQISSLTTLKTLIALCNRASPTAQALIAKMVQRSKVIDGLTLALNSAPSQSLVQISVIEAFFTAVAGNQTIAGQVACSSAIEAFVEMLQHPSLTSPQCQFLLCAVLHICALTHPRKDAVIVLLGHKCHFALLNLIQQRPSHHDGDTSAIISSPNAAVAGIALHILAIFAKHSILTFVKSMVSDIAPLCVTLLHCSQWSEVLCGTCVWIRCLLSPSSPSMGDDDRTSPQQQLYHHSEPSVCSCKRAFAEHLVNSGCMERLLLTAHSPHGHVAACAASALRCIILHCPRQSSRLVVSNRFLFIFGTILCEKDNSGGRGGGDGAIIQHSSSRILHAELSSLLALSLVYSPLTRKMFRSKVGSMLDSCGRERIARSTIQSLEDCHPSIFEGWNVIDSSGLPIVRYCARHVAVQTCVEAALAQSGPPPPPAAAHKDSPADSTTAEDDDGATGGGVTSWECCNFIHCTLKGAIEDGFSTSYHDIDDNNDNAYDGVGIVNGGGAANVLAVGGGGDFTSSQQDDCDKALKLVLSLAKLYGGGGSGNKKLSKWARSNDSKAAQQQQQSVTGHAKSKNMYAAAPRHTTPERTWSIKALSRDDLFFFKIPIFIGGESSPPSTEGQQMSRDLLVEFDGVIQHAQEQTLIIGKNLRVTPMAQYQRRALLHDLHSNVVPRVVMMLSALRAHVAKEEGAAESCAAILRERGETVIDSGNLCALYVTLVGGALE